MIHVTDSKSKGLIISITPPTEEQRAMVEALLRSAKCGFSSDFKDQSYVHYTVDPGEVEAIKKFIAAWNLTLGDLQYAVDTSLRTK